MRWLAAVAILGCGCAPPRRAALGGECVRNSDCSAPLVCRIGFCRNECATSADCPAGLSCLLDGVPGDAHRFGACQLDDEATCTLPSECPAGLLCRFGQCTNACIEDRDCPGGARCDVDPTAMALACIDPSRATCALDSECSAGEFCLSGRCRRQCYADRDCRNGWWCDDGTCRAPSIDGEASLDAPLDGAIDGPLDGPTPRLDVPGRSCGARAVDTVTEIAVGTDFGCAIRAGNRLTCWADELGSLSGIIPPSLCAADVSSLAGRSMVDVAAGSGAMCVRMSDGTVECVGGNRYGELGRGTVGTPAFDLTPMPVDGLTATGIVAENFGPRFFAFTSAGLVAWGANTYGELGTGTLGDAAAPTAATVYAGATALGSGSATACAVVAGSLVCRGFASWLPAAPPARPIVDVTVNEELGCVHDGSIVECFATSIPATWGVLGDGTMGARLAWGPTAPLPAGVTDLCSGQQHVCVLLSDRTVWCWGNRDGWDASRTGTAAVVPELAVSDADALACGSLATCIVRRGVVLCGSRYGQMIGVGTRMSPAGFTEVLED